MQASTAVEGSGRQLMNEFCQHRTPALRTCALGADPKIPGAHLGNDKIESQAIHASISVQEQFQLEQWLALGAVSAAVPHLDDWVRVREEEEAFEKEWLLPTNMWPKLVNTDGY